MSPTGTAVKSNTVDDLDYVVLPQLMHVYIETNKIKKKHNSSTASEPTDVLHSPLATDDTNRLPFSFFLLLPYTENRRKN
jgi:hypothetical protein